MRTRTYLLLAAFVFVAAIPVAHADPNQPPPADPSQAPPADPSQAPPANASQPPAADPSQAPPSNSSETPPPPTNIPRIIDQRFPLGCHVGPGSVQCTGYVCVYDAVGGDYPVGTGGGQTFGVGVSLNQDTDPDGGYYGYTGLFVSPYGRCGDP